MLLISTLIFSSLVNSHIWHTNLIFLFWLLFSFLFAWLFNLVMPAFCSGWLVHCPHFALPLPFPLCLPICPLCIWSLSLSHTPVCGLWWFLPVPILGISVCSWTLMTFWMAQATRPARSSPALGWVISPICADLLSPSFFVAQCSSDLPSASDALQSVPAAYHHPRSIPDILFLRRSECVMRFNG